MVAVLMHIHPIIIKLLASHGFVGMANFEGVWLMSDIDTKYQSNYHNWFRLSFKTDAYIYVPRLMCLLQVAASHLAVTRLTRRIRCMSDNAIVQSIFMLSLSNAGICGL